MRNQISKHGILAVIIFLLVPNFGCGKKVKSPDPNIVATFEGGQITRNDVEEYLTTLVPEADSSVLKEIRRKDVFTSVIRELALDSTIEKKIQENKLDTRENIKHVMKHVGEELNISQLHSQAHEGKIKVSEIDIQKYYEDNRDLFGDRPLLDVKEEIRPILEMEKEEKFFQDYLEDLKRNAIITREERLLEVPDPTETELRIYYDEHRQDYSSPEQSFAEVKDMIWEILRVEKEKAWFAENRNKTLFTIHGKRYTVGEFYQELEEFPPQERLQYQKFEALKTLLERLIERMLVVEDTYDQMLDTENQEELGHIRQDLLGQILHQEEVDDRIEVSEEEITAYYEEHKGEFMDPPQAKISYIRIDGGQTEDDIKRAEKKVEDAYKTLKPGFWKKGAPFEDVAREYSEDPETAQRGGELDEWISESGNLFEEMTSHLFHEIVLGLPLGEISRPFYFQGSYYIVKVRERKEPQPIPFEAAREYINAELSAQKHDELTREMGQTLLEQTNLVIYDEVIESMLNEKE